jgi:excisionase family DNA binding protein
MVASDWVLSLRKKAPQMPATTQPKKFISARQVAQTYGISTRTILRYLSEGRLKGYRVGPKLIRLDADEVERALVGDR